MVGLLRKRDSTSNKYLDSERLFYRIVCHFLFYDLFIYFFHNLMCDPLFHVRTFYFHRTENFTVTSTAKYTRNVQKTCGYPRLLLF